MNKRQKDLLLMISLLAVGVVVYSSIVRKCKKSTASEHIISKSISNEKKSLLQRLWKSLLKDFTKRNKYEKEG